MNGSMSDWEMTKLREYKIRHAIREAEQDRWALVHGAARHVGRERWFVALLATVILIALIWQLAG